MDKRLKAARLLAPAAVLGTAVVMGTAVGTAAVLRGAAARDPGGVRVATPAARAGTLTLAAAAGDVGVFVMARPRGPVELIALTGEGNLPREALDVVADGRHVELAACGSGCYRFAASVLHGSRTKIAIAIRRAGKPTRTARVLLPARLPPSGDAVLTRARRVMTGLRTLRYRETLTAGLGATVIGNFQVQAPDRLRIDSSLNEHIILIGSTRWIATNGRWSKSPMLGTRQPAFPWDGAQHARVLGRPRVGAGRGWLLAIRNPGSEPVWFRLVVAPSGRVQEMVMIARAHFMTQAYSGFNRPVSIRPPTQP